MTPVRSNLSLHMFQASMIIEGRMIARTPKEMVWMFVRTWMYNNIQKAVMEAAHG